MMLLQHLREYFGLSQSQLARLLEVSTSYVKMIETGARMPSETVFNNMRSLEFSVRVGWLEANPVQPWVRERQQRRAMLELELYIVQTSLQLQLQQEELAKMQQLHQLAKRCLSMLIYQRRTRDDADPLVPWLDMMVVRTAVATQRRTCTGTAAMENGYEPR